MSPMIGEIINRYTAEIERAKDCEIDLSIAKSFSRPFDSLIQLLNRI